MKNFSDSVRRIHNTPHFIEPFFGEVFACALGLGVKPTATDYFPVITDRHGLSTFATKHVHEAPTFHRFASFAEQIFYK